MEYRSVAELNARIVDWCAVLPHDLDAVAGIPRSGMLAANLIALHLNLPVTDLAGLCEGRLMHAGVRYEEGRDPALPSRGARVLVVDDSILFGASLAAARESLRDVASRHELLFGAVFACPEAVREGKIEHFAEAVPVPRIFEWNVMHTPMMSEFCVDIDGVLCRDPLPSQNDDGPRYLEFVRDAPALILPRYEIGWLVTSRLEKYREQTEAWLVRHGVRYRELRMMQYPTMKARQQAAAYSRYKAEVYLETEARLFIESAPHTAREIAALSGRPVFCTDTREMIYPDGFPRYRHLPVRPPHPIEKGLRWVGRLPGRTMRKVRVLLTGGT